MKRCEGFKVHLREFYLLLQLLDQVIFIVSLQSSQVDVPLYLCVVLLALLDLRRLLRHFEIQLICLELALCNVVI